MTVGLPYNDYTTLLNELFSEKWEAINGGFKGSVRRSSPCSSFQSTSYEVRDLRLGFASHIRKLSTQAQLTVPEFLETPGTDSDKWLALLPAVIWAFYPEFKDSMLTDEVRLKLRQHLTGLIMNADLCPGSSCAAAVQVQGMAKAQDPDTAEALKEFSNRRDKISQAALWVMTGGIFCVQTSIVMSNYIAAALAGSSGYSLKTRETLGESFTDRVDDFLEISDALLKPKGIGSCVTREALNDANYFGRSFPLKEFMEKNGLSLRIGIDQQR